MSESAPTEIEKLLQEIIADRKLTRDEKQRLDAFIMADGQLSREERQGLDALLTMISRGEVVVVD